MAKWDECVPEWSAAYRAGMTFPQMQQKFGVNSSTINGVLVRAGVHRPKSYYERQLDWKPIEDLADKIVLPGIEKHLEPLLHYRGNPNFGRVHRLWNFAIACMLQGCEEIGDITLMSHHPDYSHLCGTTRKQRMSSAVGFMNRLRDNPKVTDNIPGMTEWAEQVWPHFWRYDRVDKVAGHRDCAWWRIYKPRRKHTGPGNIRQQGAAATVCYPYIAHDPQKPGMDLVKQVHAIVPKHLPDEFRADICQDIICSVLAGEMTIDDVKNDIKAFVTKGRKIFSNKWDFISIDAPIPGMDGRTFSDVLAGPDEWEFA